MQIWYTHQRKDPKKLIRMISHLQPAGQNVFIMIDLLVNLWLQLHHIVLSYTSLKCSETIHVKMYSLRCLVWFSYRSHFRSPESRKISALDTMLMGSLDLAFPWHIQIQVYKTLQNLTTAVGAAYEANSMFFSSASRRPLAFDELDCPVGVDQHLVYTHVHIGVILPRLISVESYQFRWWFLVLVLGPRRCTTCDQKLEATQQLQNQVCLLKGPSILRLCTPPLLGAKAGKCNFKSRTRGT